MRRLFLQNFSRRPGGISQMIRKTVEKTLHAGGSFEGAQLTQLNRREFVQRGSFQLTDVNASCSVTQQESRHPEEAVRFSPGSARVSRVGDRVLAIADFRRSFWRDAKSPIRTR